MKKSRGKILLIDDDPLFLKILSAAFAENGFTVVTALDGVAGLKAYLAGLPEVVICDLIMPRLGGVSTCVEISRLAGDKNPIIVLLTSMFKDAPHEHNVPEMGATIHMPKTTKPVDIVILVEQLLERKHLPAAGGA